MELECAILRQKCTNMFSETTHEISLLASLNTLDAFSQQNSKTTYYEPFRLISIDFNFLIRLFHIGLIKRIWGISMKQCHEIMSRNFITFLRHLKIISSIP